MATKTASNTSDELSPERRRDRTLAGADETALAGDIDPSNEVRGLKLILIHLSVCLCTFLVGLDFNLIATAIPSITDEFNATRDIGWYGAAFQIALSATQPLAGKLYTLFSKKLTYLLYLLVFEIGSLVCALSPSSNVLIVGRAIAGLGASGLFAGGFTIVTTIIPLHKRAVWIGTMGATFSIASIVGPVVAGALTQNVTWRWCFYINLPIGGAAAAAFSILVHLKPADTEKKTMTEKLQSLDSLGLVLFAGSVTMFLLALQWGGIQYSWSSSYYWSLKNALIPPRLFTVNRNPALLCAAAFFVNGPFQIVIFWLPVWFQGVLRVTPTQSGVNFFPTVIADVLAAFLGTTLVTQLGWWNPFLLLSEAFVAIGGGLLTTIYPTISSSRWIGYQIFGGIGYSLASNLSHTAMQSSLPQDLVALGSSTLLSIISLSCAIFIAIGQAIFQRQLESNLMFIVGADVVRNIINSGVTDISSFVSASDLPVVIQKYNLSVSQVFYIPAVAPVISFILLLGCKWISTKSRQSSTDTEDAGEKTVTSATIVAEYEISVKLS
ncbi:MFS general substrate transporter [Xylaria sp. FL0064]|nr:MFS general substrate transporter [Xylaria sp. FL0064]